MRTDFKVVDPKSSKHYFINGSTENRILKIKLFIMVDMMSSLHLVDMPVGGRLKRGYLQESQQPGTTRAKYLDVDSDVKPIFNPVDSGN